MYEFFVHTIDVENLDGDKQHYSCRRCGKSIDKKNIVEVIAHRENAVDDKSCFCQSCYKPFIHHIVERGH